MNNMKGKSYDHLHKHKKCTCQDLTAFHDENTSGRYRKERAQPVRVRTTNLLLTEISLGTQKIINLWIYLCTHTRARAHSTHAHTHFNT